MFFTTLSKRQLTTIKVHQSGTENKPPPCLAIIYELHKNLLEKHQQITRHRLGTEATQPRNINVLQATTPQNQLNNFKSLTRRQLNYTTNKRTLSPHNEPIRTSSGQKKSEPPSSVTTLNDSHDERAPEDPRPIDGYYYFHVTSKSHVDAHILKRDEVKHIFQGECIHYARVFEIAITNYCIMDNHFHLKIGVPADGISFSDARKRCAKAVGCIKQQFTNRYKCWFNEELRVSKNYRIPPLETGSLWDRPAKIELIEDEVDLVACTLLVEANWLRDTRYQEITSLNQSPEIVNSTTLLTESAPTAITPQTNPTSSFQPCYNELAQSAARHKHQSILWYLNGEKGHPRSALTDGSDANWAPPEEFERLWPLAVRDLPTGYRKCWFKNMLGIIRPTAQKDRRYHVSPFIQQLGETATGRAEQLMYLILNLCWTMGPSRYRETLDANKQMGL